jgi:hypothetical protein
MNTLSTASRNQLIAALKSAYSASRLEQMLKLQLDVDLTDIVSLTSDRQTIVFRLVEWAEERGTTGDLVEAAYQDNPNNPALREFAEVVWPNYTTHSARLPRNTEAVCGITPAWSVLEDVYKAFGQPDSAAPNSATKIRAVYGAQGVDITCMLSTDHRWVVDFIRLQAPFSQKLSFSGLYIGMPLHELERACIGKYSFDPNGAKQLSLVLKPVHSNNCQMTIMLNAAKVIGILMQRRS